MCSTAPRLPLCLRRAVLLGLGLLAGCVQDAALSSGPLVPPASAPRAVLWDLAPAGATFGLVAQDGAASDLAALLPFAEGTPLQELAAQLLGELTSELPFNLIALPRWADLGLDPRLGSAFFSPAGEGSALFVLPVADRPRFRQALQVVVERRGLREIDRLDRGYLCAMVAGRYLCARTLAAIDRAAAPHDAELGRAMRARPAEERGAIEIYADARAQEMQPITSELRMLGDVRAASAVVQMRGDGAQINAQVAGDLGTALAHAFHGEPPPAAIVAALVDAPTALRVHLDPTLLVARVLPSARGEVRAALLEQLTGDVALITTGEGVAGMTILAPLREVAPVQAVFPALCEGVWSALGRLGVTPDGTPEPVAIRCAAVLAKGTGPVPWIAAPLRIQLAIEGSNLALHLGDGVRFEGNAVPHPGVDGGLESALLGPDTVALHAHVLQLGPDVHAGDALHGSFPWLDPRSVATITSWNRIGARVDEVAMTGRITRDGLRFGLTLRTFAADPGEVRDAWERALTSRFKGDASGYRSALAELERRYPDTRIGRNAGLSRRGGPWVGAGALVIAALGWLERR